MTDNLDRFDRMLPSTRSNHRPSQHPSTATATMPVLPFAVEREPVITSARGSRFVDHTACPMCGTEREGVEFHGTLMTGVKVHTIAAHSPGMRRVENGQPRCLGAGMRMVFEDGSWKGAPANGG